MIWPKNANDYTITVYSLVDNCVSHIEVSEKILDIKNLKEDLTQINGGFLENINNCPEMDEKKGSVVEMRFFSLDKRYFRNMLDLVKFYNASFGVSYREALPKPIYQTLAVDNIHLRDNQYISLKKGNKYFVIRENTNENEYLLFDQTGLVGIAFKKHLKII